ncbi:hypothetical protein MTR67_034609 [Solanum verrucosum]
MRKYR